MAEFITDREGIKAFRETDEYKKILAEAYKWHKKHGTMKGFEGGADLGIKFRPKNVVNYDKQTGLGSDPIASRRAEGKARLDKIKKQTVGKRDLPKTDTAAIEVHHQRMVDLYDNLYEGLDDADSAKLSQFFSEDLNMPLGDKYANAAFLPKKPHDKVHKFIDNEVLEGLPDFNSPKYNKVELPDGTILEGLDARKFHAKNFFGDLVQPAIDESTMGFMQDFAKNNPKGYGHLFRDKVNEIVNSKVAKNVSKAAGKTRRADLVAQIGTGVATGNVVQAGAGVAGLTASEALQSPASQKAISKQIAKLAAKRGGKSALKLIPGLDVLISGKEAYDYLAQGKFDQAGIAALSGAIGWIPVIGDGASAALDLTNTGIDISRLDLSGTSDVKTKKTKKPKNKSLRILKSAT